jgi:hypothetical protein
MIDDDNRLVYDIAFTAEEINIILNALNHKHEKPSSEELLQDIIDRLTWTRHGPGRKPEE